MKLEYVVNYKKTWVDKNGEAQPSTSFRLVLGSGRYVVIKNVFKDDFQRLLDASERVTVSDNEALDKIVNKKKI